MWTGYLLLTTVACLGPITSALFLTPDIYRPAASLLLACSALGVALFWPMIRLSQQAPYGRATRAAFVDAVAIFFPLQATIWPQAMPALSSWDVSITAAVASVSTAWLALTGALLAIALAHTASAERSGHPAPVRRAVWMSLFVALAFGAWLVGMASGTLGPAAPSQSGSTLALWSPASAVFEITSDRSWLGRAAVVLPLHWRSALGVGLAAAITWTAAFLLEAIVFRRRPS